MFVANVGAKKLPLQFLVRVAGRMFPSQSVTDWA